MIIRMELGPDSYTIAVERGALKKAAQFMDLDRKVLIVTDDGVPAGYAETIAAQCRDARIYTLPQGEANKDMEHLEGILEYNEEQGNKLANLVYLKEIAFRKKYGITIPDHEYEEWEEIHSITKVQIDR